MGRPLATRLTLLAALLWSAACTIQRADVPALAGPSELALSVSVSATPASISQDGASQSAIIVTARDANGRPISGLPFRLDIMVGGIPVDYGRLSTKTVVTGSDGRATAVYTAPPASPPNAPTPTCTPAIFSPSLPGTCVDIVATPIGSNFETVSSQHVQIHLMPTGVILPPAATPVAAFTVTPTPVLVNLPTRFSGSATCDGVPCSGTVIYSWDFGDGTTASGQSVSKTFTAPGTYTVSLTVTTDRGLSASATQTVVVTTSGAPTAEFVFSPSSPVVGQTIQFNASGSSAAAGRSIDEYTWNWGDGETGSGETDNHDYAATGTYTVTLTVEDDLGQTGFTTRTVTVSSANPTASFTFTVDNATDVVSVDGSSSTAAGGATITNYTWNWGDGTSTNSGTTSATTHDYTLSVPPPPNTYTVTLTVTDSQGRTGSTSRNVTVQ